EGAERRNYERDLARSWGYLGDLYCAQGNITKANQAYEESKKIRAQLYRNQPDDPEHGFQYARVLANFCELEGSYRVDLQNGITELPAADAIRQDLPDALPDVANFRIDLASTKATLAELYLFAAQDDSSRAGELLTLSRQAAQQAGEIYGRLKQKSD